MKACCQRELERVARFAEDNVRHPQDASWRRDPNRTHKAEFYQTHIVHAWRQAGHYVARRIRARIRRAQGLQK